MAENTVGKEKIRVVLDIDLEDIIPLFMRKRQEELVAIAEAVQRQDYDAIRALGHNLKGLGGGYNFTGISEIGSKLEQSAKARDPDSITKLAEELASYLEQVEIVYE
jgi:histidine phosphotransfer protein HptB